MTIFIYMLQSIYLFILTIIKFVDLVIKFGFK